MIDFWVNLFADITDFFLDFWIDIITRKKK